MPEIVLSMAHWRLPERWKKLSNLAFMLKMTTGITFMTGTSKELGKWWWEW
jgi:hypothetical protein